MGIMWLDLFIILIYFAGIVIIGIIYKKYVKSAEDYFLGGRSLPWWSIGMAIVVSDIGAHEFIGGAGGAYRYGFVQGNYDWIGCIPAMVISGIFFIGYFWRAGVYTVPEYLGRRYNIWVRVIQALVWTLFMIGLCGVLFWIIAIFMNEMLGWPILVSILITAIIGGISVVSGGMGAVVMNNVLQLVVMFAGGIAIIGLGLNATGGLSGLADKIHNLGPEFSDHFKLLLPTNTKTPYPWTAILFGLSFVLSPAYWIANQSIVQKALCAKNEWNAKAGFLWAAVLKTFIPILIVFPGLIALAMTGNGLADGDRAVPYLIKEVLPVGLKGLVFAIFFGALISTIISLASSAATLWTKDFYQLILIKNKEDKHYLFIGRLTTIIVIVLAVIISTFGKIFSEIGIFAAIQTMLAVFQGPTFAILILGMFWKKASPAGGLSGMIAGVVAAVLMFIFSKNLFPGSVDPFLFIAWWSFVVGLIVTVIVSIFSKKSMPEDKIKELMYNSSIEK